jgi:hypothetical protein
MASSLRAKRSGPLYIPEENQEFQEGQKLIGPEAAWRRNYEFVLQQTGDPKRAEAAANSIARTERRQELTQLATSVAGPAMRGGELATGLARTIMGGSRAAEAPAAMRALPAPRRNAMYPEEMLAPEVISGSSAENAPRLAYTRPETQYRMAVDRPAEGRPLANYERPVLDETFVPPSQIRTRNEVVTEPSAAARLASESPQADRALALSQQRARENEARFVADSEARATGEGMRERVTDADRAVAQARRDAAEREFRAMEEARATGEGMRTRPGRDFEMVGAPYDPMGRSLERMYAGTDAAAINAPRNSAQMGTNLQALVDRHFGAPAPAQGRSVVSAERPGSLTPSRQVDNIIEGEFWEVPLVGGSSAKGLPPGQTLHGQQAGYRNTDPNAAWADIYASTHSGVHSPATVSDPLRVVGGAGASPAAAAAASRSNLPRMIAGGLGAGSLGLGGYALYNAQGQPVAAPAPAAAPVAGAPNTALDRSENIPFSALGNNYMDRNTPSELDAYPRQVQGPPMPPAVAAAKRAIPVPPTRPSDLPREEPGILSRIFSGKDYQSNNELVSKPMDGAPVNWGSPESAADFFRADKALMAKRKEEEGRAAGGGVGGKPDKDAALHKALEIIHHMIRSR